MRRIKDLMAAGGPAAVAVFGSIVLATLVHQLWRAHLGIPFAYGGDSIPHALAIEQVLVNGWFWSDPRSGAPFGQNFQDWPLPDILMLLQARLLDPFTDNWAAAVNVIFLATYPSIALSAWWAAHRLGVNRWTSVVIGLLYAFLPYHHYRGQYHLFLSGYFAVPLGIWMANSLLEGKGASTVFARKEVGSRWNPLTWATFSTARTIVFCLLLATSGVYYTIFILLFMVLAMAARFLATFAWRELLPGATLIALLLSMVVVNTLGAIIYHQQNGANFVAASRFPAESETYGLKLSQMLIPAAGHRIDAFSQLHTTYFRDFPLQGEGTSTPLGLVGAVGFVTLLVVGLASLVRRTDNAVGGDRLRQLSMLSLGGFLIATIGGFATMISLLLTAQIRGWNRISVALGFMALVAVGLLVDRGLKRFRSPDRGWKSRGVPALLLAGLLVLGIADQTNSTWVFPYRANQAVFLADKNYFGAIEDRLETGAAVFQLPVVEFPEAPARDGIAPYEPLRPRLTTDDLRWSYGGIKGRLESDWTQRLLADGPEELLRTLAATGFSGLYIDRAGYEDGGAALEASLRPLLNGQVPFETNDKRGAFYDLQPYVQRLKEANPEGLASERQDALFPVFFEENLDMHRLETEGDMTFRWADGGDAELSIYNTTDDAQRARISFLVSTASRSRANFEVVWPDGTRETVAAGATPVLVSRDIEISEQRTTMTVSTNAERVQTSDPRDLRFRLWDLDISPVL